MSVSPGAMNIRRLGFTIPQRYAWGIPPIQEGDWLAERSGNLVYIRRPWEGSPLVRVPALGDNAIVSTVSNLIAGTQEDFAQGVADRATSSVMEAVRPYIVYGVAGVVGLMLLAGFAGYAIGKGA